MGYIYADKQVTIPSITAAICDNCGDTLKKVWDDNWSREMEGALTITISGGYGMHFDGPDRQVVLCGKCADELVRVFPCFEGA